ncbi:hypothetical protein KAZ66_05295 [Candidatus Woesebacteria bacterium]|nr:hypothetical protein [Candidatus Woesebacteria bacterium]
MKSSAADFPDDVPDLEPDLPAIGSLTLLYGVIETTIHSPFNCKISPA